MNNKDILGVNLQGEEKHSLPTEAEIDQKFFNQVNIPREAEVMSWAVSANEAFDVHDDERYKRALAAAGRVLSPHFKYRHDMMKGHEKELLVLGQLQEISAMVDELDLWSPIRDENQDIIGRKIDVDIAQLDNGIKSDVRLNFIVTDEDPLADIRDSGAASLLGSSQAAARAKPGQTIMLRWQNRAYHDKQQLVGPVHMLKASEHGVMHIDTLLNQWKYGMPDNGHEMGTIDAIIARVYASASGKWKTVEKTQE